MNHRPHLYQLWPGLDSPRPFKLDQRLCPVLPERRCTVVNSNPKLQPWTVSLGMSATGRLDSASPGQPAPWLSCQ